MSFMIPIEVALKGSEAIEEYVSLQRQFTEAWELVRYSQGQMESRLKAVKNVSLFDFRAKLCDVQFQKAFEERENYETHHNKAMEIEKRIKILKTPEENL